MYEHFLVFLYAFCNFELQEISDHIGVSKYTST
jgi:hypothetical protein